MSASLVGSEMCIRDSPSVATHLALADLGRLRGPLLGELPAGSWRAPVSYTHLTLPTICSV
eukprot:1887341-Alexandrium_andersonii.AAC.1